MAHYAELNENNEVIRVIVAETDFVATLPGIWVQTSYNTYGGVHPEGRPLRKNFAGIGYTYDPDMDAFIPPKPYPSWILNTDTCWWEPPVPYPTDSETLMEWNEGEVNWVPAPIIEA